MSSQSLNHRIFRRLLPLYAALFLQGFVLFYTVEKLFMRQIGFDDAGIGIMVAAYSAVMLVIGMPSGILADRWSRKGVLVLAGITLAASALVGGLSHSIAMYLVCAGLWGVFFALYTGSYDAILYDTLLEEAGNSDAYERWYGFVNVVDGTALVLGSLLGGLVAAKFGLRATYFWTIVPSLLSIVALLLLREPKLHKQHEIVSFGRQARNTLGAVLSKGRLLQLVAIMVLLSILQYGLLEFAQLWWIALVMPVVAFGPSNALLTSVFGIGGLTAGYLRMHRYAVMQASLFVMLLCAVAFVVSRSAAVMVATQVLFGVGTVALGIVLNRLLHDELPSTVRAGAASAVSTFTRIGLIPFSLVLGFISREVGIFTTGWLFVVLLLPCFVLAAKLHAGRKAMPAVGLDSEPAVGVYQK